MDGTICQGSRAAFPAGGSLRNPPQNMLLHRAEESVESAPSG
jgi:hypothetical protein